MLIKLNRKILSLRNSRQTGLFLYRNQKLMSQGDKVIGLNAIVEQLKEEVRSKTHWGQELLEKYEKSHAE